MQYWRANSSNPCLPRAHQLARRLNTAPSPNAPATSYALALHDWRYTGRQCGCIMCATTTRNRRVTVHSGSRVAPRESHVMPSRELGVLGGLSTCLYFVTTVRSHPHAHVHCLRTSRTRSFRWARTPPTANDGWWAARARRCTRGAGEGEGEAHRELELVCLAGDAIREVWIRRHMAG
jgi:hypothetical protein